jgi:hypothetical protein
MRSLSKDIALHDDRGATSPENWRLIWQIELAYNFPDIFPPVVVPNNQADFDYHHYYPVANIAGQDWDSMQNDQTIPLSANLEIIRTSAVQNLQVFRSSGIVVGDRNEKNIMLEKIRKPSLYSVTFNNSHWKIWQVDLEPGYLVDTLVKNVGGSTPPNLWERMRCQPQGYTIADTTDQQRTIDWLSESLFRPLRALLMVLWWERPDLHPECQNYYQFVKKVYTMFQQLITKNDTESVERAFFIVCDRIANSTLQT